MTRYDDVAYSGHAYAFTAPNRLAGMAQLFGLPAPSPATARVLELGCGAGRNLVPLAAYWPEATFVGLDLAARPIQEATELARAVGLHNVRFLQADVAAAGAGELGAFDFVIAHGLFSWVGAEVREAILRLIGQVLGPNGTAVVSFNAYPGAHMSLMVRELVHQQIGPRIDAASLGPSWAFLDRLNREPPGDAPPFFRGVLQEVASAISFGPQYLFHDELSPDYHPFYLSEVTGMARRHGLSCLGDARGESMFEPDDVPETTRWLDQTSGGDWLRRLQLVDIVKGARFKRALLCREAAARPASPSRAALQQATWTTELMPDGPVDMDPDVAASFSAASRCTATLKHPLIKATLLRFLASPTRTVTTADVAAMIVASGVEYGADPITTAARAMYQLMRLGNVAPVAAPVPAASADAGDQPRLRALAQAQLARAMPLTDNQHDSWWPQLTWQVEVGKHMDGRRRRADLARLVPADGADPAAALADMLTTWSRRGLLE